MKQDTSNCAKTALPLSTLKYEKASEILGGGLTYSKRLKKSSKGT